MERRRFLALAVVAVVVLAAGCLGGDGSSSPATDGDPSGAPDGPGSSGTDDPGDGESSGEPKVETHHGEWVAGAYAHGTGVNVHGTGHPVANIPGNVSGVVFEMTWNATTPASEELRLRVVPSGSANTVVERVDSSPLHVAVPESDLPGGGDYVLEVRAAGDPGAFVAQGYDVHVATFQGIPFDPDYPAREG